MDTGIFAANVIAFVPQMIHPPKKKKNRVFLNSLVHKNSVGEILLMIKEL